MFLTPANTGNAVAGVGIGIFAWSAFLKIDKIPGLRRLVNAQRKEKTLLWMDDNRGIAFLELEALNLAIHNPFTPDGVFFACGNTLVNGIMMFIYLPFKMRSIRKQRVRNTLKKVA